MHLLELAVQNVRGFTPAGRHPLKLGYVVLRGPGAAAETPAIAALCTALLYPDGRGGDAVLVAPGQRSGKAALSLQGNDAVTYRVLRELGGAGGLHRLNPGTQKPELLSQDAAEMVQVLRAQAGLPARDVFEQLYCLRAAQLPSRKPRKAPEAGPRPSQTGLPAVAPGGLGTPVTAARDVPAAQARVGVLEQELALAREVEALQFEADGLTSQLFELEGQLQAHAALRERVEAARAEARATPGPEALGLPQDIVARAARYPTAVSRRDEALAKVRAERDELDQAPVSRVPPLWKERAFWGWVAAGAAALLLGVLLQGPAKYVALLDVPLFGVAAVLALRYVEELQHHARETGRGGRSAAREKKILEDFEAEVSAVLNAVRALDVDGPKDVAPALAQREAVRQRALQLEAELARAERSEALAQAVAQKEALRAQLAALNARIEQQGAYSRDAREVERELAGTRESIALALQPPVPAAGAAAPGALAAEALEDPTPALLALTAELLGLELTAAAGLLRERCLQYFTALTDRRYPQLEWDAAGRAQAVAGGRRIPLGELPSRDLDLYAIALRMTAVERASARIKVPFLVEDVFQGLLDEVKLPLVARMLKHLGTLTQVVHATAHPGFAQMADASVSV